MRDKLERPSRSQLRAHEWQYLVLCVSLHEGVHEKREKEKKKREKKNSGKAHRPVSIRLGTYTLTHTYAVITRTVVIG